MGTRHQPILARVEADLRDGDYARARDRLSSHLCERGYDCELIARLGEICFDMHDLFLAGRYWLVSREDCPPVDLAIKAFLERMGSHPHDRVSRLASFCRVSDFSRYPKFVQDRLRQLGLETAILFERNPAKPTRNHVRFRDRLGLWTATAILMFLLACMVIGLGTVASWIAG
ncbi:MAG: hypothetical protein HZA51_12845 [Planctomycetes bacterium]|nr:hypothetical protein [Planctomycetota bacterium]